MDRVIIGIDPHKESVTFEARDTREIMRCPGCDWGSRGRRLKSGRPDAAQSPLVMAEPKAGHLQAVQMPGTATFLKTCGAATVLSG
jgi:hypothetical protein